LANGMTVLLFPDNSKAKVTVNVTYMVGSRHEGSGETGMAHLLEHLVFKGTAKRGDIKVELANRGADFNGSTSFDRTNYYETLAATEENLRYALEMEADRMINSRVARSDLDTEMTVVRSEFEMGENSPSNVLNERVMRAAFLWHSYGRSPIGSRADIEHVPIENLQAFYHKYYQPDNAMLIIAGKFDPAKALPWIQEYFGSIPKPTRKITQPWTEEPTQDGEREVILRRVGDYQSLAIAYHSPAGSHPDAAALGVLMAILSDQPSGRLYKALVESKKATSVGAGNEQLHDPFLAMIFARVRKEMPLEDVEKTTLSVIDGIIKEPPSKDEVDRARTRILKNIELSLNNSEGIGIELSEWASMGDWRLLFLDRDRIKTVTPEDVSRVAKQYLKASNRTLGRFIPEAKPDRTEIPATPDVAVALKDYKGQAAVEEGEVFDATPANIDARTIRVTLPNGMKLAMLPKKTRGATVNASIRMHFGDEKSVFGKQIPAQFAGGLLMRGTTKHTRQQLNDELDKIKTRLSASGGDTSASASISTVRDNFPAALRLAAEVLREPAFPEKEFESMKQTAIGSAESGRSEPQVVAFNALNRHISPYPKGDPRATLTIDERIAEIKKVTLEEAKQFYQDFYGASNAEISIVGDFDAAAIEKLARELFGDWKSPKPYKEVLQSWQKLTPVNETFETPDKANAFFASVTTLPFGESDPDYPAMLFINSMMGGGLRSRLWMRIREKEGLSYSVQSGYSAGVNDKFSQFLGIAICNPANINKVEAAFKDEMAKAAKEGFPPAEIEEARKAFLQERALGRSQDNVLVSLLLRNAERGWTMARSAELDAKIAALTPEQILAAFRKNLDLGTFSYFKAGDFKKAAAAAK
ncbi:MAG TPA: pitrilysin family protein, partial [Bryobacteraceae bacterium]|nr:pitrilysin family protein [Bryobacteraceae bacterium]